MRNNYRKSRFYVSSVEIDKFEIILLLINDTAQLTIIVLPEDATNRNVVWTSNNITVATVDSSGLVIARGVGQCIIEVTTDDSGYTATCKVTVPEQPAEVIDVTSVTLEETLTFS